MKIAGLSGEAAVSFQGKQPILFGESNLMQQRYGILVEGFSLKNSALFGVGNM